MPRSNGLNNKYRTFHPKEAKYIFFSNAYGTFSKIDDMMGNQDGGVGRHTAPPRTPRTDRESNSKGD